ncbi:MAG TPA: hypothetical protein VGS07_18920 [Thermoanaerobaculia bacterium]|nr:hypothetical protein [Thermoanaerobaculia bacterium]
MSNLNLQPVSRDQIMKLAEGLVGAGERRQIVRNLIAQAAQNQATARLDPYKGAPVPEGSYDLALKRAFERAYRLHQQINGNDASDRFQGLVPVLTGQSTSEPAAGRV